MGKNSKNFKYCHCNNGLLITIGFDGSSMVLREVSAGPQKNQNAKKHTHHCIGVGDNPLFELNEYFIEWIISDFFEWINLLNEYFHRIIEWIIEWIKKVRYSQEKWIKCEKLR